MSENTGRSYRRTSSRNAESRPCWASALTSASGGSGKRDYVRQVFSQIAPRYDLLNHTLSLNIDRAWRRRAIATLDWRRNPSGVYLDLCAGTLDVAVMLAANRSFTGRV